MTEARRVALLARPGAALDRMRGALGDAGARIVLEADPTRIEPAVLSDAAAEVVLVVLDAAIEESIDRFEDVLGDPSIEVIFEEAELALTREGWDAARWVRHLAAKLHHHGDVLPPRREGEGAGPEPVAVTRVDARVFPDVGAVDDVVVEEIVVEEIVAEEIAVEEFVVEELVVGELVADEPVANDLVLDDISLAPITMTGADTGSLTADDIALGGTMLGELTLEGVEVDGGSPAGLQLQEIALDEFKLDGLALDVPHVAAGDGNGVASFELADIQLESVDLPGVDLPGMQLVQPAYDAAELSAPGDVVEDLSFDVPAFEQAAPPVPDTRGETDRFRRDLADLERRISSMGLVDGAPAPTPAPEAAKPAAATGRGAVLVMAGIGGPDAVRQLLGALPEGFAKPVLVHQRLDGGRYDRLVTQMQRATTLPVKLAEAGAKASAGEVYILPAEVGVSDSDEGLVFNDRAGDVLSSLPTSDSAVLLLSGADPAVVDTVLNQGWSGALVAGQAPEGCYDAAATNALIARGGTSGQPVELARRLAERWPT